MRKNDVTLFDSWMLFGFVSMTDYIYMDMFSMMIPLFLRCFGNGKTIAKPGMAMAVLMGVSRNHPINCWIA
jgi:hypothetical protein